MSRWIRFATKLLPHHFGDICEDWVQPVFQNHDFRFSPKSPPSHKIMPKHQNHELGYAPTMSRSIPFAPKLLPHHSGDICGGLSPASFPKPWFSFFTKITTNPQNQAKIPKSWTWLCTNHVKINSFCSQTSPTSLWRHLWGIESSQFSKTMIFVFHQSHHQPTKSSQNTKIMNSAMHQPCQDQFLLLPNLSHIIWRHLWGLSPASFPKPWFLFFTKINTNPQNKAKTPKSWTWLCTNHVKINSCCSQTSSTSLSRHLWGLSPASFAKQWLSFFTPHTTMSQKLANTPNLAKSKPNQYQYFILFWLHLRLFPITCDEKPSRIVTTTHPY